MIYILPTTYLDTEAIRHDVLNRTTFTKDATVIECDSEANTLDDCSVQPRQNTACQYALVQCGLEEDPQDESPGSTEPINNGEDESGNDNSNITEPNNNGGSDESMDEGANVDNAGGDERKGLSVGVIAGVVVIVLVSLVLVIVGVLILIVVKQKAKQINDTSAKYATELQEEPQPHMELNPVYNIKDQIALEPNPLYDLQTTNTQHHNITGLVIGCIYIHTIILYNCQDYCKFRY